MKPHTEIHDPETATQVSNNAFWDEQGHQHLKRRHLLFQMDFYKRIAEPIITQGTYALHWPCLYYKFILFVFLMAPTEHQ